MFRCVSVSLFHRFACNVHLVRDMVTSHCMLLTLDRCALLGDQIAAMAVANGWSGIVINGCIRGGCEKREGLLTSATAAADTEI